MREPCICHCNVQITCCCCNIRFSCICSLHVHFLQDKNVRKYLIDVGSCKAEIVSKQETVTSEGDTEITGNSFDFAKVDGTADDDYTSVSPPEYRDELVKTSKVKENNVVNADVMSHIDTKQKLSIDIEYQQMRQKDQAILEENESSASTERQCLEKSSNEDICLCTSKKMKDTEELKRGKLLSNNIEVPCDVCGHVFKKRNLKRHMQSHSTTKEFTCEICQKIFRTESSLHGHRLHHRTEKDLVCHFCGKQFNNGPNLRQHIKSHTNERTLKCPLCPKMFRSHYVLKDHVSRHSGDKPHTCTICNRSFRKPQEVKRHMAFHSDARDHMCKICDKWFKSRSNLVKHEKVHFRKTKKESKV